MKHKEKKRNEKNNIKIIITILFLTLFTSLLATNNLAQNNPGHDTLYIEQTGDSELTGNFNVTGNTTIQGIQTQNNLVLRGDGEQTGTKARIIGSAGYLSIQSPGDIYINTLSGTTSDVYLGDGSDTVGLIVTGNLSTNGQNVCLADGTNCPAGAAETGNITGSGSTNYIPIWLSGSTLGNSQIQQSGSNIGIGGSPSYKLDISGTFRATGTGIFNGILYPNSGMQIPNTNTEANTIYRDHNSYPALVVGQYGNSGIVEFRQGTTTKVIIDNDGKVGILTTTPNSELDVNGTINATGDICLDDGTCLSSLTNQATSDTGWNDTGTTVQLVTASDNVSAGTLYIDNTNNKVGIGTTTPTLGKLVVQGTAGSENGFVLDGMGGTSFRIFGDAADNDIQIGRGTTGAITIENNNKVQFNSGADVAIDTNTLYVDSSTNNVGIGTTTPNATLHVIGTINATQDICTTNGNCLSTITGSGYVDGSGNTGNITYWTDSDTIANSPIYFNTTSGNIGIGTTNPQRLLHIEGDGTELPSLMFSHNETASSGFQTGFTSGTSLNAETWNYEEGYYRIGTNNTERIRIDDSGNVGIGTSSPAGILHTVGSTNLFRSTNNENRFVFTTGGAGSDGVLNIYNNTASGGIQLHSTGDSFFSGNVGIGTTSPGEKLEVNGSINVTTGNDVCIEGGTCLSTTASGANEGKVGIDSGATPDYLGSSGSTGSLRTSSPLSYTDGGNYITLGITNDAIGDTQLAYNTGQHLTTTSAPTFATINTGNGAMEVNTIAAYTGNQNLGTSDSPTFAALTVSGNIHMTGAASQLILDSGQIRTADTITINGSHVPTATNTFDLGNTSMTWGTLHLGTGINSGGTTLSTSELNIVDSGIDFSELSGTVSDTQIADGAVDGGTGGEITDGSITAADLGTDSVAADEIAANAVGTSEINDGTVQEVDLEIAGSGSTGQILAYNSTTGGFYWTTDDSGSTLTEGQVEGYIYDNDNALGAQWTVTSAGTYDINFDSNTFVVDTSENKVGIGTNAPNTTLHVRSSGTVGEDYNTLRLDAGTGLTAGTSENGILFWWNSINGARIAAKSHSSPGWATSLIFETESGSPYTLEERMRINYDGNVGIGTTTPNATLHVAGTINTTGGDICIDGGNCLSQMSDATGDITDVNEGNGITITDPTGPAPTVAVDYTPSSGSATLTWTNDALTIVDDIIDGAQLKDTITLDSTLAITQGSNDVNFDSNTLYINGSGSRVGIGTTSTNDGAKLSVQGNLHLPTNGKIGYLGTDTTDTGHQSYILFYNSTNGNMQLETKFLGSDIILSPSDNVGIGTSTPSKKLEIQIGESEGDGINISDPNSQIAYLGDGASSSEVGILRLWDNDGVENARIYASETNPSWIMGNLGIGLVSPSEKLDIASGTGPALRLTESGSNQGLYIGAVDTNEGILGFGVDWAQTGGSVSSWTARETSAGILRVDNGDLNYYADTSLTDDATFTPTLRFTILSDGKVGIGDPSPGEMLEVVGSINATSGDICITGGNCLSTVSTNDFGTSIDDTEMTAEDFGDFTCTGSEDGCTIDANSITLGTDTTGNYVGDVTGTGSITATGTPGEGYTETIDVTDDSIDGTELKDTITLDSTLAITQGSNDVNFDSNTLFVDGSENDVGIGTNTISNSLKLDVEGQIGATQYCDEEGNNCFDAGNGMADVSTDNLIKNGDFELGTLAGWTGLDAVQSPAYSGKYAAEATGSSTVESIEYVPVDPDNDVLYLEGYFKKTVDGTTPGIIYFGYKAYNENKSVITTAPCGTYCYFAASGYDLNPDGSWHKFSAITTGEGTSYPNFPVGTKFVRPMVLINYGGSSDTVTQMDHISLKKINQGALFVGNDYDATNRVDYTEYTKIYTENNDLQIIPPSSGSVGIGNTAVSGSLKLDVEGTVGATQYCDEAGNNCIDIANVGTGDGTVTSVTAGTGMTQTGTSTINPTLNVIGGTGITANADNIELGALTTNWDAGNYEIRAQTLESDVTTGTAPLTIASTTVVTNLNTDLLDGEEGTYYTNSSNQATGTLPSARLTGSYTGITGLGTIGTGTWQGTSIGTTYTDAKDTTDDNVVGDVDSSEITNGAIKDEDLDLTNITLNTFTNDAGYITSQTDDQTFAEIGAGTATSVAFVIGNSATLSTTGTGTITATTANTGDSATSFFSTGTLEVAIGGTGTTTSTGSGNLVLSTSPTLTTPNIGAATGTSLIASGDINTTTGDICIDGGNCLSQMSNTSGTVTSVAAGNGMDFTTITGSGTITLGTPTTLTSTTTNSASATTHTHAITTGIANTNIVKIDHASAADNDYAKLTANGIEGRSYTEVKTDLSLNNVENTALSTWPGTTSITTLGTIGTGTWTGTSIGTTYTDAKDTTDDNVAGDVDSSEITDGTINESDLNITNTPTDNYLLSFDDTTGGFTWVAADGSGTDDQTFAEIGAGTITSAAFVVGNSATLSATGTGTINATDLICTDCIGATEISDSYLLNNGDTMDGTLTMGGSTSNIALGSNWLSNDGDDEGVWVTSTGNVGIGITTPNATLHVAGTINTTGGDICIYGGNCLSESLTSIPDSYVLTTGDTMSGPLRIRDVGGGATINIGADRTNYADTATIILQEDADNTYGTNGYGFRHRYDGSANTYYFDTASTTTTTNIYTANLGSNIIDFKATPTINGVPMIDIEVDGSITNELQTLQEVTNQGTPTTTAAITIDSDGNEQTNIGGTLYINGSSLGERVGIGTTSPSAMLEIESSGTDNANMDIDAPSGEISLINFQSAGTTKFQIQGKSASDHFVIWDNVNSESRINLRSDNGDNNYKTGMVGGTHEFLNSTEDTLMTIAGDGYVSIGTTSTSGKLTIDQNANDEALYITGGSGGQPIATFIRDLGSNGTIKITSTGGDPQIQFDPEDSGTVWSAGVDDGDGDSFKISYGGSIESGTAGISIQTDGDVGIGTTSPGAGLDVHNNVIISDGTDSCAQTENGDLCVDNDLEIDGKIMLRTANTDGILNMGGSHGEQILFKGGASVYEFVVEYDDGAAGTSLVFEQDTNPVLVLNTTGEVLVGGASDSGAYKLQVNGNICEDDGTIATCSSDERLKENILDIENATEYLIKFRPRTYNFIGESKKMSGFIAQEVNETHPELFVEKEDGYYTWDNPGLEIITVKAIQELNERINNLETENDLMKEDLCFLGIQRWC